MSAIAHPVVRRTVDGGYSGTLTVTVGTGNEGTAPLVLVESDLLESTLVLSMSEAADLGFALSAGVSEARHMLDRCTCPERQRCSCGFNERMTAIFFGDDGGQP